MKVFYLGLQKENYDPKRGFSFEYHNFYLTLAHMAQITVKEFPYERIPQVGRLRFNEELAESVKRERPDLVFAFMYTDELLPETLDYIRKDLSVPTVAWFADDYWRFWNYSRRYARHFSHVVTTSREAIEWYKRYGFSNIILSQWACNTTTYAPRALPQDLDVSFVGQRKSARAKVITHLNAQGIDVHAFGFGWPNGKISQENMMGIFSRSKINLNLNVRPSIFSPSVMARLFLRKSADRLVPDFHFIQNIEAVAHYPVLHTHARPFELAGCKAFVISGHSEGIEEYYKDGEEMVFYRTSEELVEKIRFYLPREEKRKKIAEAAYARTLREHTYEARFQNIFRHIGIAERAGRIVK